MVKSPAAAIDGDRSHHANGGGIGVTNLPEFDSRIGHHVARKTSTSAGIAQG